MLCCPPCSGGREGVRYWVVAGRVCGWRVGAMVAACWVAGLGFGALLLGPFGQRQWSRGHLRLPALRGVAEAPMGALLLVARLPALRGVP